MLGLGVAVGVLSSWGESLPGSLVILSNLSVLSASPCLYREIVDNVAGEFGAGDVSDRVSDAVGLDALNQNGVSPAVGVDVVLLFESHREIVERALGLIKDAFYHLGAVHRVAPISHPVPYFGDRDIHLPSDGFASVGACEVR